MGSANQNTGDRSQRTSSNANTSGTSQSPHAASGMAGPSTGHYGMSPYGSSGSTPSINSDSNRFPDTQRLSHTASKSMHRTADSNTGTTGPPQSNQSMGNTQSNTPASSNRPVGRSPHNVTSGGAGSSSFYPSSQFQSPPRSQSSGTQSSAPLPTPPLHHHGSRIMDQSSAPNHGRPNYGPSGSTQPYGANSSNFASSGFDPPPLHYTPNRPPSTQSTASSQSLNSQKSSGQSRSESRASKSSSSNTNKTSQKSSSSSSRSKQSSNKKTASSSSNSGAAAAAAAAGNKYEVDTNLSNSIFETRSITPMFPGSMGLSPPPPRNLSTDGPTYLPGNLFNAPRPLSNSNALQHKGHPADMTFNSLFPASAARGPQNGLGLNFQPPGFPGMNPHSSHQSSGHMTPHTTSVSMPPHINYLGNSFLTDMPPGGTPGSQSGQSDSLNISPIKFQHSAHNSILGPPQPPPSLGDPSPLQHHHHQGPPPPPTLYAHNRAHPMGINPMAAGMNISSLLGQHHGFDPRAMTPSTMTPPFGHVHTPSFGMPNFLMHDH